MKMRFLERSQETIARRGRAGRPLRARPRSRLGPRVGLVVAPGRVLTTAHVLRGDEVVMRCADGDAEPGRVAGARPRH